MGKGGSRFGAGRPSCRAKCEHTLAFDIREVKRRGLLKPGESFSWSWSRDDERVGSIGARVEIDRVVLSYQRTSNGESKQVHCNLWIAPCAGGFGARQMFLCPCCAKRVAVVYFGGNAFACRRCLRLVYVSEGQDKVGRLWRKQQKIESRLIDADTQYQKPKGMHWRTFERLCDTINEIEQEKDDVSFIRIARLLGGMGLELPGV